ncbi:MAG: hypothetical protein V3V99_15120 [candidate division Zixibacteria bacterium]
MSYQRVLDNFNDNLSSIKKLLKFDEYVIDVPIRKLEQHKEFLKKHKLDTSFYSVDDTINSLKQIRQNKSLKTYYNVMYNQCVVLLVSYFSESIKRIFEVCINESMGNKNFEYLNKEEIKVSIRDLYEINKKEHISLGELLIRHKDIKFQDMKSIYRAFNNYTDTKIMRDSIVDDIILGQAARHIIVHSGGKIDNKFLSQISSADKRNLKTCEFNEGDIIEFTPEEIELLSSSMVTYIKRIIEGISDN